MTQPNNFWPTWPEVEPGLGWQPQQAGFLCSGSRAKIASVATEALLAAFCTQRNYHENRRRTL